MKPVPSHERLKHLIDYDPDTGAFQRRLLGVPNEKALPGVNSEGYLRMMLDGRHAKVHQWAWYWMTGEFPCQSIDHINGVKSDNRWANLRAVSGTANAQNQRAPHRDSKLGVLGVAVTRGIRRPFRAQISVNNRTRYIGMFATAAEAHEAYLAVKRRVHEGCTL